MSNARKRAYNRLVGTPTPNYSAPRKESKKVFLLSFITENYVVLFEFVGILVMLGISAHVPPRMKRQTFTGIILLFVELIV